MKTTTITILITLVAIITGISAFAAPLAVSTFDTNSEGWVTINWDGTGGTSNVDYLSLNSGGNVGGCIHTFDMYEDTFWRAPAKFKSNFSSAYGGTLSFDTMTITNPDWVMYDIYIVGNGQTISYAFNKNPTSSWKHYSVTLSEGIGWMSGLVHITGGTAATAAEIQHVLSNITDLRIRAEFTNGGDSTYLDNVILADTKGDVNSDTFVNVFDALLTLQYAVGLYKPIDEPAFKVAADVAPLDVKGKPVGNSMVDVFDALAILRYAVELDQW